jgi:hypothetical protein
MKIFKLKNDFFLTVYKLHIMQATMTHEQTIEFLLEMHSEQCAEGKPLWEFLNHLINGRGYEYIGEVFAAKLNKAIGKLPSAPPMSDVVDLAEDDSRIIDLTEQQD